MSKASNVEAFIMTMIEQPKKVWKPSHNGSYQWKQQSQELEKSLNQIFRWGNTSYLSLFMSVRRSVSPSVRPSVRPSIRPSVHPSVGPSVGPSVRPSVHPSVRLSICSSIHPSVHLSVHTISQEPYIIWS